MYTYAFLPHSNLPLDLPEGISGSLQLVTVDRLSALVEPDLAVDVLQRSDDLLMRAILCHDQVIREVFEQTTVLPLRFGTCFVSQQGLMEHLGAHSAEYLDKLTQLEGRAEYLLKLVPIALPEPDIALDLKGRDYFLAKKRHYQSQHEWQQQQQQELQELLMTITQSYRWQHGEPLDGIERIYVLSDRDTTEALQNQLTEWQVRCPHWEMSLGEALPPYHFVE